MTVETTAARTQYTGNGVTTAFATQFKFNAAADLVVTLADTITGVETAQVLDTDYTVSGAGVAVGGTVTFSVAPPSTKRVIIERVTTLKQELDYVPNDPFPAESHESGLDKLTMAAQEHRATLARSLRLSASDLPSTLNTLPIQATRAGKYLGFSAEGQPVALGDPTSGSGITLGDLAAAGGSALVGFQRGEAGAVLRTIQAKLYEQVSPEDFDAAGDGIEDDAPAWAAALAALKAAGGGVLFCRFGATYRFASGKLRIPSNVIVAGNWSKVIYDTGFFARGLLVNGALRVGVTNLRIELADTTAGATWYGLAIQNSSYVYVDDVHVIDPNWSLATDTANDAVFYYGFLVSQSTAASEEDGTYAGDGSEDQACDYIVIRGCLAKGCYQYGYEVFPKVASKVLIIEGNVAEDVGNAQSASLVPAGFKVGQCYVSGKVYNNIARRCWVGMVAACWSTLEMYGNTIEDFHDNGILLGANDHGYFDGSTGGNGGTGHHDGVIAYTRERCHIHHNHIYQTAAFTPLSVASLSAIGWYNGNHTDNGKVIIEHNVIDVKDTVFGIEMQPLAAIPNVVIRRNDIKSLVPIFLRENSGNRLAAPVVEENTCENIASGTGKYGIVALGDGARVRKNTIIAATTYAVWVKGAGSMVLDNTFIGLDAANADTTYAVLVNDTANSYYVMGNRVIGGNVDAFLQGSGSGVDIYSNDNTFSAAIPYFAGSSAGREHGAIMALGGGGNGCRIVTGTAAPSAGAWAAGDICINSNPSAGGTPGWVCTGSGSPGTWKAMANLAA